MRQHNFFLMFLKIVFFSAILVSTSSARAELKVVTTIKPLHSLIANVMDGVGEPALIIEGSTSPHSFTLKPSHAKLLEEADIIFWIGEGIETFMERPLESIVKNAEVVEFMEIESINKLKFREESIFEEHDDHDDHDDHDKKAKKDDDHDHDHDSHAKKEDGHDDHDEHHHGEFDPHIWLDPINAKAILNEMVEHLIENDAANASIYKKNLDKALNELDKLTMNVMTDLNKSTASIVFHDAYQYFEERFNVNVLGAFTVNTDVMPGAEQLKEIREIIEHDNVSCVFSELQFNPDIINAVAKDMNIKTGILDPLGATLNPGKGLYFDLIKNMSSSFKGC